jgi:hypothetical protein
MSLPPDTRFSPSLPGKQRISAKERQAMDAERAKAVRLRVLLDRELELQGIRDPTEIGAVIGLTAKEAEKLLTRRQWRAGDLALLEGLATRLGLQVPDA